MLVIEFEGSNIIYVSIIKAGPQELNEKDKQQTKIFVEEGMQEVDLLEVEVVDNQRSHKVIMDLILVDFAFSHMAVNNSSESLHHTQEVKADKMAISNHFIGNYYY